MSINVRPKGPGALDLLCDCGRCRTPWATLLPDGRLAVYADHHSERHLNTVSLSELVELRRQLEVAST